MLFGWAAERYDCGMIRRSAPGRCFGCGGKASRLVKIDGRSVGLCDSCPSPAEIRIRAERIRNAWPAWRWRLGHIDERHGDLRYDVIYHLAGDSGDD